SSFFLSSTRSAGGASVSAHRCGRFGASCVGPLSVLGSRFVPQARSGAATNARGGPVGSWPSREHRAGAQRTGARRALVAGGPFLRRHRLRRRDVGKKEGNGDTIAIRRALRDKLRMFGA